MTTTLAPLPPLKTADPPTIDQVLEPMRPHLFKMLARGQFREAVALLATMAEVLTDADCIAWQPQPLPLTGALPVLADAVTPTPGPIARATTAPAPLTPSGGLAVTGARIARSTLAGPAPVVIPAEPAEPVDGIVDHRPTQTVTLWHRAGSWFGGRP